jgi:membrane-bound serine protease (ClpP class)
MKEMLKRIMVFLLFGLLNCTTSLAQENAAVVLTIDTAIGPATQDYIHRGLETAQTEKAQVVILQLDTPGGLDMAMRGIVHDILTSPIPIITYVAPSGARAASAGTYILYASALAAMAPGTNVGAATPVSIGGFDLQSAKKSVEERKTENDAMAYLRSLAQLHDRNIPWTEKAVAESASLSANEALKLGVIDVIAADISSLLSAVNGRTVLVQGQKRIINTLNLKIYPIQPDWRTQFLAIITNPNIAYVLLLLGFYGLFFEFFNPGFVLPGVVGLIALLLALYAFQLLPVNYAGLALIISGIVFFIAEIYFPSGILAVGGIAAFIFGSILLLQKGVAGFGIAWSLILLVSLITAIFFLFIASMALRAHRRPVVSGREELLGSIGVITQITADTAFMRLRGELWQVKSKSGLRLGDKVEVVGREGLILWVKPKNGLN